LGHTSAQTAPGAGESAKLTMEGLTLYSYATGRDESTFLAPSAAWQRQIIKKTEGERQLQQQNHALPLEPG